MNLTSRVTIRLSPPARKKLLKLAKKDRRTEGDYYRNVLEKHASNLASQPEAVAKK